MQTLAILGSTGSIGTQTLDVVRSHPEQFRIGGISAHGRWKNALQQAQEFAIPRLVLTDESLMEKSELNHDSSGVTIDWGEAGIARLVQSPEIHKVVAAMVGAAGLFGAVRALEAGKNLALANKETLVVGGPIVMELARRNHCDVLPVDSEHSAIFQCLQSGKRTEVARIVLTASGGPFRKRDLTTFERITVGEALAHPTWRMGAKITIDSATMMNKALEIIEARWLFDLKPDEIVVVIHPQSIVHSFVEFVDGSVLAQASPPDMRLPIQYALSYPNRLPGPARKMDWSAFHQWEFSLPDFERYPALELGFEVARLGGTSGAALNAANEEAVAAFLNGRISFPNIVLLCKEVLRQHSFESRPSLDRLVEVDRWARQEANLWISRQFRTCSPTSAATG
jgi:1-deoxy-D-xylulose-5-phosphate reductoisomerase